MDPFWQTVIAAAITGVLSGIAGVILKTRSDEGIAKADREASLERWKAERQADAQRWREQQGRADRDRFLELRRERYAAFLHEADRFARDLRQQRVSGDEVLAGTLEEGEVPPLGTTEAMGELVAEVILLAPDVGAPAQDAYMELVWAGDAFRHRAGHGEAPGGDHRALVIHLQTTYLESRRAFLEAAQADLGTAITRPADGEV